MTTTDRYRNAVIPVSTDGYGQPRAHTITCTDCGALILDTATHDAWHGTPATPNAGPPTCPDCDHGAADHGGRHGCAYRPYKAAICGCTRTPW